MIETLKTTFGLSVRALVGELGIRYATLMRWKRRLDQGRAPVEKPGPKKVGPLDLGALQDRLQELGHGRQRSRGTGRLKSAFGDSISRRELERMIGNVRREVNRKQAGQACQITWLRPNLAWAMDDCRCLQGRGGRRMYLHNLSDLCSHYKFSPLASRQLACGEEVAGHLAHLFSRFGPPLFCKRDNGGNLNHTAVDQVLAEALVVPINNPANMPAYNGAIEHTQGEFKNYLRRWDWKSHGAGAQLVLPELAAHDLNHSSRRSLGGENACRAYFGGNRLSYPKRKRQEVYHWIRELAAEVSVRVGKDRITPAAWREAAKQWLVKNRMIVIQMAGEVLPDFPSNLCHH